MNRKTTRLTNARYFSMLAGALAFGGAAAQEGDASAFWSRQSGQSCFYYNGTVNTANNTTTNFVSGDACNTNSSFSTFGYCPITDTSSNPKTSITTLNVHMTGNGFLSSATRCVRFWNAVGGACGTGSTSFASGNVTLTPTTFANWDTSNFGYLLVLMNGVNAGSQMCLRGYYSAG